jgi:ribA/ribD-fused uncharacterized protein
MMKYSNEWLISSLEEGEQHKYMFFWGHKASNDGSTTKSCFSQWWPAAFTVDGISYPTAEHWMMVSKAKLFADTQIIAEMLATSSPANVKKLGRKVKDFEPALWEAHKYSIVVEGNLHKFAQHPELKTFLLNTGERILVEASPVDAIWGIGMAADHAKINDPSSWRGENLLGYALMEVRDKLKENEN